MTNFKSFQLRSNSSVVLDPNPTTIIECIMSTLTVIAHIQLTNSAFFNTSILQLLQLLRRLVHEDELLWNTLFPSRL